MKRFIAFLLFLNFIFPLSGSAALSTKTIAPDFQTVTKWLGSGTPVNRADLHGKIVLLTFGTPTSSQTFWEFNLFKKWYRAYSPSAPFTVVAFMVPEFNFQKNEIQMEALVRKLKVPFPVGLDMARNLANLYNVPALPFHFLIDHEGRIRAVFSNKIDYKDMEKQIRLLLQETPTRDKIPFIEKTQFSTFSNNRELWFGYKNIKGYGNPQKLQSEGFKNYLYPENLTSFQFYIQGNWKSKEETLEVGAPPTSFKIPFEGKRAGIVAGSIKGNAVPAEVKLDGVSIPKALKGKDIIYQEGRSYILIKDYAYYRLLNLKKNAGAHILEIHFEEPGAEIFKASFN